MLDPENDFTCGIFDSTVTRKKTERTEERTVGCYELEFFPEAGGVSVVDGAPHEVKRGMLLCARPGQKRWSVLPVKCAYIRLFAAASREAEILSAFPVCAYADPESADLLDGLFLKLGVCFLDRATGEAGALRIHSLFYKLLYECQKAVMRKDASLPANVADVPVLQVREYIDEHFKEPCTLEMLAQTVHLSPNYLHTLFRKRLGKTPLEYLTEKRIAYAKRLLLAGKYSLSEIALDAGFCSQSHFSKVFRQKTSCTPTQYLRHLMAEY